MALEEVQQSISRPGRFTPGEKSLTSTGQEVQWTPGPVWTL